LSYSLCVWAAEGELAAGAKPPVARPGEVTLKGVMMFDCSCSRQRLPPEQAKAPVLFAMEGTPELAATLAAILRENWPGDSMDGDQAKAFNDAFSSKLKYYLVPNEITARKENASIMWSHPAKAVTGVRFEKDGKKWITPSKIEPAKLTYPEKMLGPDKPIKMPGKDPLLLKITDTLTLKCILVPAGKLLARDPFYLALRFDDPFPILVTLTRPYYLAEIPVTQDMYEAVTGSNPSDQKGPRIPVHRVPYADMLKFCRIVSEKSGRTVRLPSECEWEYAARVGTSNPVGNLLPEFATKHKDQNCQGPQHTFLPVKSKQPNAWGFYDMISDIFEATGDQWGPNLARNDGVDLRFPAGDPARTGHKAQLCGKNWAISNHEGIGDGSGSGYTLTKFRILVEATPEEIAVMEKAAG
jgi:hypothetical protein